MNPNTIDDAFLIIGMALIAWGFWDPTKLVLILAGALVIFVILKGDDDNAGEETIRGPEEKTG